MKYLVNKTVEMIRRNSPSQENEVMIRVDGFEDIRFYDVLAHKISDEFSKSGLSVDIKLAKNKWDYFLNNSNQTSHLQSLQQNGWIAGNESITRYRNLHSSNLLVLMGTESEEDKGGLSNCYCVTSDTIIDEIDGQYSEVFEYLSSFSDSEKAIIDKLFKDLFSFVPADIYKLSGIADEWESQITNIGDFVELFFANLNRWGLPFRKHNLPSGQELKGSKNVLELEYSFISRSLFKKMTLNKYKEYNEKLNKYKTDQGEYGPNWDGWDDQEIHSYDQFANVVMEYVRGENSDANRFLLENTDFDIVSSVLDIKLDKNPVKKNTVIKLTGNPLTVFTKALLYTMNDCIGENITLLKFDVAFAEIVSMYSDTEDAEEKDQLAETWKAICRHTNEIISIINKRSWKIDELDVNIELTPAGIFSPNKVNDNIDDGFVRAAGPNKTNSKIEFSVKCFSGDQFRSDISSKFSWEFQENSSWLHAFSDICNQDEIFDLHKSYVPLTTIAKMNSMIFAKSEEEFFDSYEESDISFRFNVVDHVQNKAGENAKEYTAQFIKLGYAFSSFVEEVKKEGFYASINKESQSEVIKLITEYIETGKLLASSIPPENSMWILDAYIHSFNIEANTNVLTNEIDAQSCIVPPWHPATLQKMVDQNNFFLDGCQEWWDKLNGGNTSKTKIDYAVNNLEHMSMIQSAVDLFPTSGMQFFGSTSSFGEFSVYARNDIENNSRLKDIIHKDAVFDDDFNAKEFAQMNDNAKMIYGVIYDYVRSFQNDNNISLVFINPMELQPIVAAVYKYVDYARNNGIAEEINIVLKILVKPENKGGRNYLSYWMDEFFSQDSEVNIRTYLNEWSTEQELDKYLNGNHDIVFMMDLLRVNSLMFIKDNGTGGIPINECRFPIVYRPTPISETTVRRKIELSQPQFSAAYEHTQIVRFRNNTESVPVANYIAVREVCINQEVQKLIYKLHSKAYWVVCIDSGMDGALLKNDEAHKDDYSIIGFSTGKGAYGQYNLTITARRSILASIRKRLSSRLYQLFKWDVDKTKKAADVCLNEAGQLDGISLFSAVNPKDHNINEFMAYVLTSLRERKNEGSSSLRIMIHLDSYKHWFSSEIEKDEFDSASRPDFLLLEVEDSQDEKLHLDATVIECKIASAVNADEHKMKAIGQVEHGINRLSALFNPDSTSIMRRYWYAQLYRALAFAQVTFSDNTQEFAVIAAKLRAVLDGKFDISWTGRVLGYWLDMDGDTEAEHWENGGIVSVVDVPQKVIQSLLLDNTSEVKYVNVPDDALETEEEQIKKIENREKELSKEIKDLQKGNRTAGGEKQQKEPDKEISETKPELFEKDSPISTNNTEPDLKEKEGIKGSDQSEIKIEIEEKATHQEAGEQLPLNVESRVLIGTDKSSNKVYWEFGNPELANRHMLITGTSGQGKTYSIQTMLYELSKSNVSAIVFDYTEGFRPDQLEQSFLDRMGNKVIQHIIYYTGVPINPFKKQAIDVAGMSMPEKSADVAARIANIFKHVYGFGDQQFSAIFEAARKGLDKYGEQMNMKLFQDMLEEEKANNKTAQSVLSKMAPFLYSIEFNNEEQEFDWGKILYADNAELNIFQLTSIDREMQVIITELMLWDAWYYTKKVGSKDRPFVAILDEAQNLSHKSNSPSAAILTEGRKFGWSAWFATQSLKVLADDEVVRLLQAANKLYFKPTDDEMTKMSKQLDPTDGSLWLSALKNLKKGQCIVVGDRIGPNGRFGATRPTVTTVTSFEERE